MPTYTLSNNVQFFYEDTGAPGAQEYTTFFVVHGHTYHSGLFKKLLQVAHSHSHRMIAVNRREYAGSTPYSEAELKVFAEGPDEERFKLLITEGANLALLLDGLIDSLSLPKNGDIAIVGWSLGNIFTIPLLASINTLPPQVRDRLGLHVKRTILWDAPSQPLGIESPPEAYNPLWDEELAPEARGVEFGKWLTYYFVHGDLSNHDMKEFNYRYNDPNKKRTFEDLPLEELFKIIDLSPGAKCDTPLCEPPFAKVERDIVKMALFDSKTRAAWRGMKVWHILGYANAWNVHLAAWKLEEQVHAAASLEPAVDFTILKGVNHFGMWDDPEALVNRFELCLKA
ncbi:hypothetical protein F5051DRAFT_457042 [Lentinula edodes]|nr:hypothetical protein F5051DRAFT_457042 [Lentinula edodes]